MDDDEEDDTGTMALVFFDADPPMSAAVLVNKSNEFLS